ncbi:MAG TPA: Hpt domain-containing protein [Pseudoduganella sp.]|jgi:two-component system sensor histidine kinase/response regulator
MTVKPVTEPTVLDVDSGIERLMGNSSIYSKALKRFTAHIEAARSVAAQLAAGDDAGAYLTIHTLKGAAGLLGAGEVAAVALDVETALSRGGPVQPLLDDLEGALQRVQVCIDAALAAPMPKNTGAPAATAMPAAIRNVPALLDRVGALLDEGNSAALDMLDKYAAVLEKALGAAAWGTITAATRNCDFESALAALQGARSTTLH